MKTYTIQEKMDILAQCIQELDLYSYIGKRHNKNYRFFVNQDSDEDMQKLHDFIIEQYPDLQNQYEEECRQKNRQIFFFEFMTNDHYGYWDEYIQCDSCYDVCHLASVDYNYYKEETIIEDEEEGIIHVCNHCLKDYYSDVYIKNKINKTNDWITMFDVDHMKKHGWKEPFPKKEFEAGMYGIWQEPEIIVLKVQETYSLDEYDFIFVRTDESPYHQEYTIMIKKKEVN